MGNKRVFDYFLTGIIRIMRNKTSNNFRLKVKRPRQSSYHLEGMLDEVDSQQRESSQRFSSEYITLARKFQIKMMPSTNSRNNASFSSYSKDVGLRVRTQISKSKGRYRQQALIAQFHPHSQMLTDKLTNRSSQRSQKVKMFNMRKHTMYSQSFMKMKTQIDVQQQTNKIKIKQGDQILSMLGNHCRKLLNIKQSLQKQSLSSHQVIRQIKVYVLRQDNSSIARIDKAFDNDNMRRYIRQLVMYQRLILISLVLNIATSHLYQSLEQSLRSLEIILGYWLQILSNTYNQNIFKLQITQESSIKETIQVLSNAKLMTKKTLEMKIKIIFKYHKKFLENSEKCRKQAKDITINRGFYQLLTVSACYLTQYERKQGSNLDNLGFFATCPSPYLVKTPRKPYTLVLDLDQTLVYKQSHPSSFPKQKPTQQILYRPTSPQFIYQLSHYFQIVIFTTSLQSYARQATKQFGGIDYYLFRQHAVRMKNGLVKDLKRIGRDITKIIIIDDNPAFFRSQKENGIWIKAWKGDNQDQELTNIKEMLLEMAIDKPADVRPYLDTWRSKRTAKITTQIRQYSQQKRSI